jgi:putative flippase GtrA
MKRLVGFVAAGGVGFVTDAAVLLVLTETAGIDPLLARVFSFAAAVLATWAINRTFTFGASDKGLATEGARYGGVAIAVGCFNYLIYAGLLLAVPGILPFTALVISSVSAMALSWLGYSQLVFRSAKR